MTAFELPHSQSQDLSPLDSVIAQNSRRGAKVRSGLIHRSSTLIYSLNERSESDWSSLIQRLSNIGYTGVQLKLVQAENILKVIPAGFIKFLEANTKSDVLAISKLTGDTENIVVSSFDTECLIAAKELNLKTCFRQRVVDAETLHQSIQVGREHDFLCISFKDPTNIPLELVIASLQYTDTVLIKEIAPNDTDDAIVSLGVMEVGADGVMYSPQESELDRFFARLHARRRNL